MAIKPDYQAGTVSLTAGATALVGAGGANWLAADIQPGDTFKVQNLDAVVASVTDATHIVLAEPWTGTTLAAAPYRLRYQPDGSRLSAATRALIDLLGNGNLQAFAALAGELDMIPVFTGAGALVLISKTDLTNGVQTDEKVETIADRAAFDGQAEGFSVLVADVGDGRSAIYFKLSSSLADWSDPAFLTGANGTFQSKGAYSGATSYVVGDVVLQNGSSWIARVNTTGNAPPTLPTTSNTQWFLLSAAGNGFVFKGAYSGATAYVKDDVVLYNNSSWIALISTTGNTPPALPTTVNTQWQLLAARGAGDVSGPASSGAGRPAVFADATGKVIGVAATDRNILSNGAMQVSQENGNTLGSTSGYYAVDQWLQGFVGPVVSFQQIASVTPKKSANRIRQIITTADASLTGTEFFGIVQTVEGLRISSLGFGSAGAIPVLLSFGLKAPIGTYSICIRNAALNRSYVKTFAVTVANVDTYYSIPIPGDVTGTWVSSSALGMFIGFFFGLGPTFHGTDGAWQAGDIRGTVANTNGAATLGNTFDLFDVALNADPYSTGIAPEWKAPDFGDDLRDCQRYFQRHQVVVETGALFQSWAYPVQFRLSPTISGGGAGFSVQVANPDVCNVSQTARSFQTLMFNARP
ncbi:hypothetical protein [Phyllobacterium chamaecytisi]|uniref:hypothetical protein n=1 Tax=Phyllobacterium chamaecytisi TaxID=2876082 RepID=UPI001CCCC64E|nr:hypothetical protein [Phyllobacterium sp. KW56]MBZ9600769.1 hypothetical protein [Phyllobacterium sp. KW56]